MTNLTDGLEASTGSEADGGSDAVSAVRPAGPGRAAARRLRAAEALVAVVTAVAFTLLCRRIDVNPMVRIGQVSGLAAVQEYAALLGLPCLGVLLYSAYRSSLHRYEAVQRLVCAAVAGLATGVVAGGIAVALSGTPWGLGGQEGDPGNVMGMADDMLRHRGLPGVYPPLFPAVLALWAKLFRGGIPGTGFAMKDLQLLCSALAGPVAYLAWRLLLRPFWALLIAVPSAVFFLDPIRPYSHVSMIVMVPMMAGCLRELTRAGELPIRALLIRAAGFGAVFGLLFLWYSGWFVWTAPGVLVLALYLVPWRRGAAALRRSLAFLAVTLVSAAVVGSPLLVQLVRLGAKTNDRYAYVMTYLDPSYVMGWISDRSGGLDYHDLPVRGELAGQSALTLLLLAGVAVALGLGLRDTAVRTALAALASAWLLRFWFASRMERTQAVQLYPRTTWIIMYTLMILTVLGLMLAARRFTVEPGPAGRLSAGAVCAVALFATMGASWSANQYMPTTRPGVTDMGVDAYRAHILQTAAGQCPAHSPVSSCDPVNRQLHAYTVEPDDFKLWCGDVPGPDWPIVCGRGAPWLSGGN